jgi:N-acetylmuramoyl-L-alanine amidase
MPVAVKRLAVDAGHGRDNRGIGKGYDPGAVAGGVAEADVALAWALTLRWVLSRKGIAVWMTRDDDRDPDPVSTRDDRAEAAGCDRFLSIHCNAANGKATGTETFYRDSRDEMWAAIVQDAAIDALGLKSRGLKSEASSQHKRLAVFDFDGPCCLLEIGFIDNAADRARMLSRDVRLAFAEGLAAELTPKG